MTIDDVITAVDSRAEELFHLVSELIAFKTPAPPARNTSSAQDFVEKYLASMGYRVDRWDVHPGDPNVVGEKIGSEDYHSLIINGHIDVAEIGDETLWESDPFIASRREGRLFGRGTADMKGGLAGALFALKLLHESGLNLPGNIVFQSVVGEEVGEAGTKQCCEKGYIGDMALVVDTSDLAISGQGGVITGWITIKSPTTWHDGTRAQMIHAGGGLIEANAIEKMQKVITALQELERHWAVTKCYPQVPLGATTINPAVIEGGRHAAFVADECRLWITVHTLPNEQLEDVTAEIENHIIATSMSDVWLRDNLPTFKWGGSSMILERGEMFPAVEVDTAHPAVRLLQKSHHTILGEMPKNAVSPSVCDGGWLGQAGIPTAIYGPGDLLNAHSVNESISEAQLIAFTKVMASFVYHWVNKKR